MLISILRAPAVRRGITGLALAWSLGATADRSSVPCRSLLVENSPATGAAAQVAQSMLPHTGEIPLPGDVLALHDAVDKLLETTDFGEHSSPSLKAAFTSGVAFHEVFLVTHQEPTMQKATAELLAHSKFDEVPRLILASPYFSIRDPALLEQATLVELSNGGEFSRSVDADIVHVSGGDFFGCLRTTVLGALQRALENPTRQHAEVIFHSPTVYGDGGSLAWTKEGSAADYDSYAEDYLRDRQHPELPKMSLLRSSQDEAGYHYDFVRSSDHKTARLTVESLN